MGVLGEINIGCSNKFQEMWEYLSFPIDEIEFVVKKKNIYIITGRSYVSLESCFCNCCSRSRNV